MHDLDWHDAERRRDVPVRLYWPGTALGAPPLLLFSHGFGGRRDHATWLGRGLAARGVAVLHLQHVGSDLAVWTSGPHQWVLREWRGDMAAERLARVADARFALDRLLSGTAFGRSLDARRIAAAGHSLGAQTALLLGGARLPGAPAALREPRVSGVVSIGLAAFAGHDTAQVMAPLAVPSLHITTEDDRTRMPGYAATPDDRVAWFRRAGGDSKVMAVFREGRHALFNDAGPDDTVAAASAELVHAFLARLWSADAPPLAGWQQRHAALLSRFETLGPPPRRLPGLHA